MTKELPDLDGLLRRTGSAIEATLQREGAAEVEHIIDMVRAELGTLEARQAWRAAARVRHPDHGQRKKPNRGG